ncbi:S-layer homology domain-containing protein, partial [Candidatus Dojkabacteria bacterium]|nr:S-layer homology domain-containing protein [Candidatus Dojkabacteria bacterium]
GGGGNRPSATPAIKERGFENISSTVQSCVNNYSKDNDRLTDIKNDSFEGYIISLNCRDAIKGYPDKTYRSDERITRGQMAKYIVNSFKIPINKAGSNFIDIRNDEIFYDYIITLKNSNIASGFADGTYRPGDFVKRQEVSKFIVEAIKVKGVNIYSKDATYLDLDPYNKFRGYIGFLSSEDVNNEKIIQGFSDGSYRPNDYVTRGQMAKIIENSVRYLEKYKAI